MSNGAMIYSPDGTLNLSADAFVESVLARWPDAEIVRKDWSTVTDVTARIPDPEWQIFHGARGDQLRTDGSYEDQLEFAAWAANLLPDDGETHLLLLNKDATVAALLRPGMTPAEIEAAWTMEPPE